jgi:hypothetical protein
VAVRNMLGYEWYPVIQDMYLDERPFAFFYFLSMSVNNQIKIS